MKHLVAGNLAASAANMKERVDGDNGQIAVFLTRLFAWPVMANLSVTVHMSVIVDMPVT
ncbi:hypothetical protein YPF_1111 [Yersinia pestis biovar Orientalis str. India 195]|uniref:Uncharacterized protein n=1 Tax=Yersinia pestis TaxID=632 RepID=Q8CKJ3_YERPE|nr:hypothetical [Yersinia pestis KIM10+]EEO75720.1 hypothetical protein YP516_3653 [Yersinia pestis Nepal516]EEO82300.1 hypothetical protein YPF_1111 [Yersinia pestis biovar Orientalis str. India 195]EEO87092.1 hypothetical protein YPH_3025 [Yersinia pestis biovar Orientalis str. PEXU2]EEO91655.1 hypothetical protein YPS_0599 [Yersinia pestis Pestoides A]